MDYTKSVTYLFILFNFHQISQGCCRGRQSTALNVTMWLLVIAPRITWLAIQETGSLLPNRLQKEFDQMDNGSPVDKTRIRYSFIDFLIKPWNYFVIWYILTTCIVLIDNVRLLFYRMCEDAPWYGWAISMIE